jgi:hypothetical protein
MSTTLTRPPRTSAGPAPHTFDCRAESEKQSILAIVTAASHGRRRVTPNLIEFYKRRGHRLRAEAIRSMASAWVSFLTKFIQLPRSENARR